MDGLKKTPTAPAAITVKTDESSALTKLARQHLTRFAERLLGGGPADFDNSFDANPVLRKKVAFLIRDFCAEHLRDEVKRFAGLMEMKLLKHDPARGTDWKIGSLPSDIFAHINELMGELETAITNNQKVGIKAADIANHLMILTDLFGELDAVLNRSPNTRRAE